MKKELSLFIRLSVCFFALLLLALFYLNFSLSSNADPFSHQVHASSRQKHDEAIPVVSQKLPQALSPRSSDSVPVLSPVISGVEISVKEHALERAVERRAGVITDTLYQSADRFGVPVEVILNLADIFSWDINFGVDTRTGDHFNIVYEVFKKEEKIIRSGRIVAAEIINRGKSYRAYYFAPEGERGDYYDEGGHSLRKAFLKSPLRYRYISSGYARRRFHPVLKINRPHLGIDFAARKGTPVRAAGDGVITSAGWRGGHGKTVIIRHHNGYKTLYGHLSSFARGIKKGKKVMQADFIGRVGSTGLSTGPHLHYTLFKNGRAMNPKKADLLRGAPLSQKWLTLFAEQVELTDLYLYPTSEITLGDDAA